MDPSLDLRDRKFQHSVLQKLFDIISKAEFEYPDGFHKLSVDCRNFLQQMLRKNPSTRPTADLLLVGFQISQMHQSQESPELLLLHDKM